VSVDKYMALAAVPYPDFLPGVDFDIGADNQ
jgi:hypothetical protein